MTGEVSNEGEKNLNVEKPSTEEEAGDDKKENEAAKAEDKEPEAKVKSSVSYTTHYWLDFCISLCCHLVVWESASKIVI